MISQVRRFLVNIGLLAESHWIFALKKTCYIYMYIYIRVSKCHCRATTPKFTEFAQNLEMCTCIKKSRSLLPVLQVFAYFYTLYVKFWVYFGDFLA